MKVRPYGLLKLGDKVLAVRFQEKVNDEITCFDIGIDFLQGVNNISQLGLKEFQLKDNGKMYITEEEISLNKIYPDRSKESDVVSFCTKLLQEKLKQSTSNENKGKKTKKFKLQARVKTYDPTVNDFVYKELESEVYAENALKAIKAVKDMYEKDLGVNRDDIKVKVITN